MRGLLLALSLTTGCRGMRAMNPGGDTDTEPFEPTPDTGVEEWFFEGDVTVSGSTLGGTTTIRDEVVVATGGDASLGTDLCRIVYPVHSSGPPSVSCPDCEFALAVRHDAPETWQGAWCDLMYGDPADGFDDGSWMNDSFHAFGFDASYLLSYHGSTYGPYSAAMVLLDDGDGGVAWVPFSIDARWSSGHLTWERGVGYYAY